jgi:hypothetical protein
VPDPKPYYADKDRAVLAAMFGEASLPLIEAAAHAIKDLSQNPVGKVEQCQTPRCLTTRIRVLDDNGLPTWLTVFPARGDQDGDRCARDGRIHKFKTLKYPSY